MGRPMLIVSRIPHDRLYIPRYHYAVWMTKVVKAEWHTVGLDSVRTREPLLSSAGTDVRAPTLQ